MPFLTHGLHILPNLGFPGRTQFVFVESDTDLHIHASLLPCEHRYLTEWNSHLLHR